MSVSALRSAALLLSAAPLPDLFSQLAGGRWSGVLTFKRDNSDSGIWSGNFEINGGVINFPGVEGPVSISVGRGKVAGNNLVLDYLEAASEALRFQGRYAYIPGSRRPHHIAGKISDIEAAKLERMLLPTLRRSRGLLARTLRLPRRREVVPNWLATRRVEGNLDLESLEIFGQRLETIKFKFYWDGPDVDVPDFSAQVAGGRLHGFLRLNLGDDGPYYKLAGRFTTNGAREVRLEADGLLETRGSGEDLLRNLRAEGSIRMQPPPLTGVTKEASISALWSVAWDRKQLQARLFQVRLDNGREVFTGEGSLAYPDKVEIEFSGENRKFRLTGALSPLSLEIEPAR